MGGLVVVVVAGAISPPPSSPREIALLTRPGEEWGGGGRKAKVYFSPSPFLLLLQRFERMGKCAAEEAGVSTLCHGVGTLTEEGENGGLQLLHWQFPEKTAHTNALSLQRYPAQKHKKEMN